MRTATQQPRAGALSAIRAGYGAVLLLAPGPVLRCCGARQPTTLARRVTRVLGVRHLAQAALTAMAGQDPVILGAGAAVDVIHAASMAGLAIASRSARRAALTDAALETVLAASGAALAR